MRSCCAALATSPPAKATCRKLSPGSVAPSPPGPPIPPAYGELATLHIHAGNLAEAASTLRTGLTLAPTDAHLLRRLAYVEAMAG